MPRDDVEYGKLVELRDAFYDKASAEKLINETNQKIRSLRPKTIEAPALKVCTRNVDSLKEKYAKPYKDEAWRKAEARAARTESRKKIWLLLLILGAMAAAILVIFLVMAIGKWCSAISFYKMHLPDGDDKIFTGVHLFALSVLVLAIGFFIYSSDMMDDILDYNATIIGVGTMILAGILFVVSLFYYWGVVDGFGTFIGAIACLFALIPDWFVALFAYIIILAPIIGSVVGLIAAFRKFYDDCWSYITPAKAFYKDPYISYSQLENSSEYKRAKVQDAKENELLRIEFEEYKIKYAEYMKKAEEACLAEKKLLENAVIRYQNIIAASNNVINNTTILHRDQRNIKLVNTILYYFEYNRAYNIPQALNAYEEDEHRRKIRQLLEKEIKAQEEHAKKMAQLELQRQQMMVRQHEEDMRMREAELNEQRRKADILEREARRLSDKISEHARNMEYHASNIDRNTYSAANNLYDIKSTLNRY